MTRVHFLLTDPSGTPLKGSISLTPTRRLIVDTQVRLPKGIRADLVDGETTVDLMPSTTGWAWRVSELVVSGIVRYVAVPDSVDTVEYADLAEVDKDSLDTTSANIEAWEIVTRVAQDMLDQMSMVDKDINHAEELVRQSLANAQTAAENAQSASESNVEASKSKASAAEYASSAAKSAGAAKTSETNASASATTAEQNASNASTSAVSAKTSETNAANSEANAKTSETAAKTSETNAAQSANAAQLSAADAAVSKNSASTAAESAAADATSAAESKDAAAQSAADASQHADAAKISETNAAQSASNAAVSESNAAASATAAQQAVEGFDLTAGSTTTGAAGTNAMVKIRKNGNQYAADFTIPRGDQGEPSPVVTDSTLTGDGTNANRLGIVSGMGGRFKNVYGSAENHVSFQSLVQETRNVGHEMCYIVLGAISDDFPIETNNITASLRIIPFSSGDVSAILYTIFGDNSGNSYYLYSNVQGWQPLLRVNSFSSLFNPVKDRIVPQVLESGVDLLSLKWKNGVFIKKWGRTVVNAPTDALNGGSSRYYITASADETDWSLRIDPLVGGSYIYYALNNLNWKRLVIYSELSSYVPLSTYKALETRVQALEAKFSLN